jgi:hypothetical protein
MRALPPPGLRRDVLEARAVTPRIAPFLILFLVWSVGCAAAAGFSLRHRLVDRFVLEPGDGWSFQAADMDGDGADELVRNDSARVICEVYATGARQELWDGMFDPPGSLQPLGDVTGDGHPDLMVVSFRDGAYWLSCYDPRSRSGVNRPLYHLGPYLKDCPVLKKMGMKGSIAIRGHFDGDGDGRVELYLEVDPFVPGVEPRRLYAFDGATGALRWSFDLATPVVGVRLLNRPASGPLSSNAEPRRLRPAGFRRAPRLDGGGVESSLLSPGGPSRTAAITCAPLSD